MDEFYNLFPLLNIGIAYLIYSTLQSEKVTKHIDAGGLIHNGGRVCGIGIISFLISMGTFIVIYYIYMRFYRLYRLFEKQRVAIINRTKVL